jgi:hypothetical protein
MNVATPCHVQLLNTKVYEVILEECAGAIPTRTARSTQELNARPVSILQESLGIAQKHRAIKVHGGMEL